MVLGNLLAGAVLALNVLPLVVSSDDTFYIPATAGLVTYSGAVSACAASGGVLASMHSDGDFNRMKAACRAKCDALDAGCGCWIGLQATRILHNDGSLFRRAWWNEDNSYPDYLVDDEGNPTEVAWHPGEPNNGVATNNEDCAHIWKTQNYDVNDMFCSGSYYPLCRAINNQPRRCKAGWDNDPVTGECSQPLECACGSNFRRGYPYNGGPSLNNIGGCGLLGCSSIHELNSVGECNTRCKKTVNCQGYSWATYGALPLEPTKKTCTVFDTHTPTSNNFRNQVFCRLCWSDTSNAEPAGAFHDAIDFVGKDAGGGSYKTVWMEFLAEKAAESALATLAVVALVFAVCLVCRSQSVDCEGGQGRKRYVV